MTFTRVLPGAEPLLSPGNDRGVLVLHGYTGSPQSMRYIAEYLAREGGYTVHMPRLPGHGTSAQDMAYTTAQQWIDCATDAFRELRRQCSQVFVLGLSMGGTLALHLAGMYPEELDGVIPINAPVFFPGPELATLAFAPQAPEFVPGIGSDIADPDVQELAYSEVPVATIRHLYALVAVTHDLLPLIQASLLVFQSDEDHVVAPANGPHIVDRAGSQDKRLLPLERSYHVATLDYDKTRIASESLAFIRRQATAAAKAD